LGGLSETAVEPYEEHYERGNYQGGDGDDAPVQATDSFLPLEAAPLHLE
jgi:hypothetical protein